MSQSDLKKQAVWQVMAKIPSGLVVTYGQLAVMAGFPGRARWVGRVLSELPADTALPWHRVLNASGHITHPNRARQQALLRAEGVTSVNQRISLASYQWHP